MGRFCSPNKSFAQQNMGRGWRSNDLASQPPLLHGQRDGVGSMRSNNSRTTKNSAGYVAPNRRFVAFMPMQRSPSLKPITLYLRNNRRHHRPPCPQKPFLVFVAGAKISRHARFRRGKVHQFLFQRVKR
jgi:hypothetical protein